MWTLVTAEYERDEGWQWLSMPRSGATSTFGCSGLACSLRCVFIVCRVRQRRVVLLLMRLFPQRSLFTTLIFQRWIRQEA